MIVDPELCQQLLAQRDALSAQLFAQMMAQGNEEYLRAFFGDSRVMPTWSREDCDHYATTVAQAADHAANAWHAERLDSYMRSED